MFGYGYTLAGGVGDMEFPLATVKEHVRRGFVVGSGPSGCWADEVFEQALSLCSWPLHMYCRNNLGTRPFPSTQR